ncbi:MAG: DJ-1/PfpI family protein, partial [Candidatus Heimdallarchaeota archaeon]|nr:DJ-1/PfpI family protein [Candidatus Heimdallarchaeota archaeon]
VDAYNAGLVLAAICHGPWVLAEAGIISGRNISGNIGIQIYIVDAGANYISDGIVIDGPFVTADVDYMYDFAQQGILKGLGLFESNPPEIHSCTVDIIATGIIGSVSITVGVSDSFDTQTVIAKLFRFDTDDQEYILSRQVQLSRNEENTIYSNIIELFSYGNYTLWLEVEDVLGNGGVYEDAAKFILGDTNSAGVSQFCLLCITVISLLALIPFSKKMK